MSYRPRDINMGDFWFLEGPDALHMYYLEFRVPPRDRFAEEGIGHATSTDGIQWTEQDRVIGRGEPGSWDDAAIYTGSAIEVGGKYYMLYTGLTNADHCQRIGLLTSDDMMSWERFESNPVIEPDARWYETLADVEGDAWVAWRDPYLFWHEAEQACYAYITGTVRGDAPREERGCVALARSENMFRWELLPPIAAPGLYREHEVPQVFQFAGRWYMLHSTALWRYSEPAYERKPERWCQDGTHYLVASDPLGPWEVPPIDVVAGGKGKPPYAARAQQVGDDLLLYHWGPVRRELAVPMKLSAEADGRLRAIYYPGLDACAAGDLCAGDPRALSGSWELAPVAMAETTGRPAVAGFEAEAHDLVAVVRVVPGMQTRAGLGVSEGERIVAGVVDLAEQQAAIVTLPAGEVLAAIPWDLLPVTPIHLRLLCDGEVVSLYLDDEFAVAAYVEGRGLGGVRLVVQEGSAEFSETSGQALDL
jgi:beta-fructofuranosidase